MSLYSLAKRQCQVQGHAIARTHQLMQEVHKNRSTKLRLTGLKIKKEWDWEFHSSHNFHMLIILLHTHFSMTLLRFSAKLRLCLPVEVWWEKSHWGREARSLVLWDTYVCVYTHTHTAQSRRGVDRSDIWSCLTGQEKSKKKRGEENKRREERRRKSLPGFHAFCLLHLSGFEEITAECLACLAQHL